MKLGIDIVEVDRLKNKEKLWYKILTQEEINYVKKFRNPETHVAGFFAAKEAFSKALSTGFRGFFLKDIWIEHDSLSKPRISFSEKFAAECGVNPSQVEISISHEKHYAVAVAIIKDC